MIRSHVSAMVLAQMIASDLAPVVTVPQWKAEQATHPKNPTKKRAKIKAARKQRNRAK